MDIPSIIAKLRAELPAVFARREVSRLFGNIISPKTLANLDSSGDGPPRFRSRRHVCYERDAFLDWLASWLA